MKFVVYIRLLETKKISGRLYGGDLRSEIIS